MNDSLYEFVVHYIQITRREADGRMLTSGRVDECINEMTQSEMLAVISDYIEQQRAMEARGWEKA